VPAPGIPPLRQAVAAFLERNGFRIDTDELERLISKRSSRW
jgi:aspartate/methionine/tyrosine aminotransferase